MQLRIPTTQDKKGRTREPVGGAADQHSRDARCWRQSERKKKKREPAGKETPRKRQTPEQQPEYLKMAIVDVHDEPPASSLRENLKVDS